jgi:hypothetical protein
MSLDTIFKALSDLDFVKVLYILLIILVYFIAQRITYRQIKAILNQGQSRFKRRFKDQIENATCINNLLDKILFDLNADRVYIFQYHNGGSNVAGIPFARCSNTHERCEIGITPNISMYQNLPLAMYGFRHDLVARKMTLTIDDLEIIKDTDKSSYNLMRSQGIKSLYLTGMFALDGTPLGFIGVDYERDYKTLSKEQVEEFEIAAQKISGCLESLGCCDNE